MGKKILSTIIAVALLISQTLFVFAESPSEWEKMYLNTGEFLQQTEETAVGSVNGEWKVIGLARAGLGLARSDENAYLKAVETYVEENMDEDSKLDPNRSTEHSRLILALTALGKDPNNVSGYNLLYALGDFDFVIRQGLNGPIWALIALDCGNYDVPERTDVVTPVTRQVLIEYILDKVCADGGWNLYGDKPDVDMTAMAIQALAAYYDENNDVKYAVDKALAVLAEMQDSSGAFYSYGSINLESTAQVVVALTSLGINPETDQRFIKEGNSLLDGMAMFYIEGGGFSHLQDGQRDGMATEQGYYAMTAYERFLEGKTPLYDMSDVKESHDYNYGMIFVVAALCICLVAAVILLKHKARVKHQGERDC